MCVCVCVNGVSAHARTSIQDANCTKHPHHHREVIPCQKCLRIHLREHPFRPPSLAELRFIVAATHAHIHTHTCTYTGTHTHVHVHTHVHTRTRTRTHTRTHTHTHTNHIQPHSHPCRRPHPQSLTYAVTHTLTHTLTHSPTHTLTHSLTHSLTPSLTHTDQYSAKNEFANSLGSFPALTHGRTLKAPKRRQFPP